jgi:1,4-alpha-glucan branching enzyme
MPTHPAPDMRTRLKRLLQIDPWLAPYAQPMENRLNRLVRCRSALVGAEGTLASAARTHHYFGLQRSVRSWIFREWAPNATTLYLIGEFSNWQEQARWALQPVVDREGCWEIEIPLDRLANGQLYRLRVHWPGGSGDRIPAYARRVVQDPQTLIFNAQIWCPEKPYPWQSKDFEPPEAPILIYESHVGMAQEREGIGTYREFADRILPRIVRAGYNTVQLMAVQEHPYYGSFGYQVSSFFAASSRFGTPEDLKYLVDRAHGWGLRIVMDLVHSHSVANEVEGLSRFDGTLYQYFHDGPRGHHHAWDSRCFDYAKLPVLQFLLANCRFWLEEYRFDGFRFDGVTSMLYRDHGLEKAFTRYDDYFGPNVDEDAVVYLALANELIHELRPEAVTIAEDISGLPALALPLADGGVGFDYRFAMGVPDYWIRLTKDTPDEQWSIDALWHELTNRRAVEQSISYAECHDQALVGDQTLIFRMADAAMYDHMHRDDPNITIDRAMALHKMIRLATLATAGHGYLNFMGNEFGHPEWIDFPRRDNNWSYRHARRQWHLVDHPDLKYGLLAAFDRAMLALVAQYRFMLTPWAHKIYEHSDHQVLAFERSGLLFVFHFDPVLSRPDYPIPAPPGKYRQVLNTDAPAFGGHGRLAPEQEHWTLSDEGRGNGFTPRLSLYLPSRTALVLFKDD